MVCSHAGGGCSRGSPPPAEGVRGCHTRNFFKDFWCQILRLDRQFGPENKLIEGQPNEYDVICRNASVLAFHLWPTIFAGAPFRLQNICRNSFPPRSRTTTPLHLNTVLAYPCSRCASCSCLYCVYRVDQKSGATDWWLQFYQILTHLEIFFAGRF